MSAASSKKDGMRVITLEVEDDVSSVDIPPVSGCTEGREAGSVRYLVGTVLVEFLTWGFPSAYGVFQRYYLSHLDLRDDLDLISSIGTVAAGVPYIGGLLAILPLTRWPQHRRKMVITGCTICTLSLFASSFATQAWHLLVSQGVLYAIGFICLYNPLLSMLNEWYVVRRGLAYGVMSAIAGTSGFILPYLLELGLASYGHATTLRAISVAFVVILGPAMLLLKSKTVASVPNSDSAQSIVESIASFERPASLSKSDASCPSLVQILCTPKFLIFTWSNVFQGLFNSMPSLWICTYAKSLGISDAQGTSLLVIMNATSMISQFLVGWVSDHYLALPAALSPFVSAIAVFALWFTTIYSPERAYPLLICFVVVFGLAAGGYSVFYGRWISELTHDQGQQMWLWSIFEAQRGIGIVTAGPISGIMIGSGMYTPAYKLLILLTGGTMAVSSLSIIGWVCVKKQQTSTSADLEKDEHVDGS